MKSSIDDRELFFKIIIFGPDSAGKTLIYTILKRYNSHNMMLGNLNWNIIIKYDSANSIEKLENIDLVLFVNDYLVENLLIRNSWSLLMNIMGNKTDIPIIILNEWIHKVLILNYPGESITMFSYKIFDKNTQEELFEIIKKKLLLKVPEN